MTVKRKLEGIPWWLKILRKFNQLIKQWNLSNPTHQGTREMCQIVQDVRILRFYLLSRNTLGPYIFVWCHRMSENSGVGLHKFHCIYKSHIIYIIRWNILKHTLISSTNKTDSHNITEILLKVALNIINQTILKHTFYFFWCFLKVSKIIIILFLNWFYCCSYTVRMPTTCCGTRWWYDSLYVRNLSLIYNVSCHGDCWLHR